MDPEVGAENGGERLAEFPQTGFVAGPQLHLGHHHPHRLPVLQHVEAVNADFIVANALRRLLSHLDLGDEGALRCLPPGEFDARRLTDDAAASVAPDEILGPQ